MSAEKRSISAPVDLFRQADARKQQLGYSTFSDYIQALLRADSIGGGDHLREASPASSGKGEALAKEIVSAAHAAAAATPPDAPVSYKSKRKAPRHSIAPPAGEAPSKKH